MKQCLICQEENIKINYVKLDCNHTYCIECFLKYNNQQCCNCFKNFTTFKEVKKSEFKDLYDNSDLNNIIEQNKELKAAITTIIEENNNLEKNIEDMTKVIEVADERIKNLKLLSQKQNNNERKSREYEDLI